MRIKFNGLDTTKAEVIQSREDFFPQPTLLRLNGRYYTAFGRLFAVAGNHIDCTEDEYKALANGKTYGFASWSDYSGIYRND
jgi:hypothetical protein